MKKIHNNEPEIRFSEFKNSGKWVKKRLEEVVNNKKIYGEINSFPYIEISDIDIITKKYKMKNKKATNKPLKALKNNILISKVRPYRGAIAQVKHEKIFVTTAILVLENKKNNDSKFLFTILNQDKFFNYLKLVQEGSTYPRVKDKQILKFEIYLPPTIEEQKNIANFFLLLDREIEILEKKIENLKLYKKGMLQKLLDANGENNEPEIRFPEFRNSGKWVKKSIKEIFDKITRGKVLSKNKISKIKTNIHKYPVYSSQTLNNGIMGYYKDFLFENAIIWTTDGANAGNVKYIKDKFYCTNVSGVLFSSKGYANKCVAEILNINTKKYINHTANPKLMNNVMEKIEIYIPPTFAEQEKIANFFSLLDKEIEINEKKLENLKLYKKGLLQKMLV